MSELGPIFSIIIICVLGLVAGEQSKYVKTEKVSHRRNGKVYMDDIDRILKRLEDSETLTQRLLDRVDQLESRDQLQQEEIRNLKIALNRRNEHEVSTKRRARSRMSKDRLFASRRHTTLSRELNEIKDDASHSMPDRNIEQIHNIVQQQRIRQLADTPSRVAFMASVTVPQDHMGVHQHIIFDNVITNIGNAYHNHLGSFIAPLQGTYVLSVTLMSQYHTDGHFALTKNSSPISTMYLSGPESGHSTASQTVVLSLQQGDDVNIHNIDADKDCLWKRLLYIFWFSLVRAGKSCSYWQIKCP